jgi:hypothetical protein
MKVGTATALTGALVGALALGVWAGLTLGDHRAQRRTNAPAAVPEPSAPQSDVVRPQPTSPRRTQAPPAYTPRTPSARIPIALSAPELNKRLKPLLQPGADMSIVSKGFRNAEDFAATVHASRNVDVPFMVLKHHVVEQGKSLTRAIRELKPAVNAAAEAKRAVKEARADLTAIN